ncbi:MAG: membrane protein insertion efficiency factor YidD [Dehalococcoidia bacterium]|nr:membrane protein insertion efficiency factor YidD [Dehalococcoidia bacterium]
MKQPALALIRLYQRAFSPYWPAACRYSPTCSDYAYEAVLRYGVWKGGWLALRRLARCRPLGGSGYDPVPNLEHLPRPGAQVNSSIDPEDLAIGENCSVA